MIKGQPDRSPGETGSGNQAQKSVCWGSGFWGHHGILLRSDMGGSLDKHLFWGQSLLLDCKHLRLSNKLPAGQSGFGLCLNADWCGWLVGQSLSWFCSWSFGLIPLSQCLIYSRIPQCFGKLRRAEERCVHEFHYHSCLYVLHVGLCQVPDNFWVYT